MEGEAASGMHNGMLVHLIMRASFRDTSHPVGPLFSTVHLRLREAPGHIGVPDPHRHPTSSPPYAACEATDRVWHAYCTAITLHFPCLSLACTLYNYHTSFCIPVFPARHSLSGPSSLPSRVSPRGPSASGVPASSPPCIRACARHQCSRMIPHRCS